MPIEDISGLRQPADNDVLWRYMRLSTFMSLLEKQCLHFSFLSEQADGHEGRMTEASRRIVEDVYKNSQKADVVASNSDQAMRSLAIINCWTLTDRNN